MLSLNFNEDRTRVFSVLVLIINIETRTVYRCVNKLLAKTMFSVTTEMFLLCGLTQYNFR